MTLSPLSEKLIERLEKWRKRSAVLPNKEYKKQKKTPNYIPRRDSGDAENEEEYGNYTK